MEEVVARALQLFVAVTVAYALALWFALIVWAYRDITARSTNVVTHIFSTLIVVLFFIPGAIIYLILRPRETLDEAFQRTMEEEYLLQDLDDFPVCPSCRRAVRDEFLYCPHCRAELRRPCDSCNRLLDLRWEACPYCGEPQRLSGAPASIPATATAGPPVSASEQRPARKRAGSQLQAIDGGRARERTTEASDSHAAIGQVSDDTDEVTIGPEPAEPRVRTRGARDRG